MMISQGKEMKSYVELEGTLRSIEVHYGPVKYEKKAQKVLIVDNPPKEKNQNVKKLQCWICGKDHRKVDCPDFQKKRENPYKGKGQPTKRRRENEERLRKLRITNDS
jgi:hypothetical protein